MPTTLLSPPIQRTARPVAGLLILVLALSVGAAGLAGVLAAQGPDNPLNDPTVTLLAAVLPAGWVSLLVVITGGLGAVVAAAALGRPTAAWTAPTLAIVGLVELGVFGFAVQGIQALSLAGYLVAMAVPVGVVVLVVQTARRYPRLRGPVLAVTAIVLAGGLIAGLLRPASLLQLATDLGVGFAKAGAGLGLTAVFMTTAIVWAVVAISAIAGTDVARRATAAVTRHRRLFTVLAALGPLPYALARATWLTPWPQLAPTPAELTPDMRLWGLLLGSGAALGVVLTIGLIRPWGERFPRWMPGLAGRSVPVAAAAVPGGVVAAVVSAAAAPMLIQLSIAPAGAGVTEQFTLVEQVGAALIFPFWFWGPMLALAVWGYVGHRLERLTSS